MDIIRFIAQCVAFQNKYGRYNWEKNKEGIYGDTETRIFANNHDLKEWLLQAIVWDLDAIIKDHHNLIYGSSGHHVWISNAENNERLAMIFVRENETKLAVQFDSPSEFSKVGYEITSPEKDDDIGKYQQHIQETCDRLSELMSVQRKALDEMEQA